MSNGRIRIAGVGNALAGDDAIGIRAIEEIRKADWKHVETVALPTPGPELFDGLNGDDLLILIDACQSGALAGSVRAFKADEISTASLRHCSTHGIGLSDWIALTAAAGEIMPEIRIFAVEIEQCGMGKPLSAALIEALPELLWQVRGCIETCCCAEASHA
ncbi:MAG: hydrogenase maturation protease [Mariprofundaceae bacterium]|nr:hydrogenase maturation protease [Mariprofundaceae bacterium]